MKVTFSSPTSPSAYPNAAGAFLSPDDVSLTPHELRVLVMLANGYNRISVAGELGAAIATVAWYLQRIYQKLQVHSKAEAVAKALRMGLIR